MIKMEEGVSNQRNKLEFIKKARGMCGKCFQIHY